MQARRKLTRYATLSLVAAVVTILLKVAAYLMTGSVGLLSDALESGVNLIAAVAAMVTLIVAAQPPDEEHVYGHTKVEYFSVALEGLLIMGAALTIIYAAVERIIRPVGLQQLDVGLLISVVAAAVNLVAARILLRAGDAYDSATLRANAQHLTADVWTSAGVLVGVGAVALTGWQLLDPVIALLVAGQIILSGIKLVRQAALGLMDTALPVEERQKIAAILDRHREDGVQFHALRTRRSGAQRFVSVHIQVPGAWTVQKGHTLLEEIEAEMRAALPRLSVFTHLEPVEDPASWNDIELLRS